MRIGLVACWSCCLLLATSPAAASGLLPSELHQAVESADAASVADLLDAGADLEERDAYGRTPLYVAARRGDLELTRQLLERGADPNAANVAGLTALHAAAAHGHTELARVLLANCASVSSKDRQLRTPLHLAAARGHRDLAVLLVDGNAALEARLSSGQTPYDLAISNRQPATFDYLRAQLPPLPPKQPPAPPEGEAIASAGLLGGGGLATVDAGATPAATGATPTEPTALTAATLRPERPRGAEATVRFVQEKLTELGYDPGPVSGVRTAQTLDAVRAFQDATSVLRGSERGQITSCLVDRLTAVSIRSALDAAEPAQTSRDRAGSGGF